MTPGHYETLLLDIDQDGIALLTVNRPDKLNALNSTVLSELESTVTRIREDDDVKLVILTGAGEKAFVAGADIKELNTLNSESGEELSRRGQEVFAGFENLGKPVIALVNGYALGGGAELAMACHMRIATDNAVFGLPEVGLGLIPGYGGTQRLPALIGKSKAMELILTGGQVKAGEAMSLGLVNGVYSTEQALDEAKKLASKILKNGPVAVEKAIEAVNSSDRPDGFEKEAALFGELCDTEDFKEGTSAFLDKRKPDFKGR
ncbi:enoyl-CoA hydratase/isomerase family protein [Rhodohalobacter mucosus]|uniref:Enoyl-CoA hydratase n=1 Tax=Rhodohalobacter mucosus TaxID=2079485 RepID=A0A316TQY6_9BACT|nr:enoyl-CoA hydratase-related protein [Rhodohalobacter mucosus]PWN05669.1 enoyl-CoA hydratase [Rhodohalobacter mucosus]